METKRRAPMERQAPECGSNCQEQPSEMEQMEAEDQQNMPENIQCLKHLDKIKKLQSENTKLKMQVKKLTEKLKSVEENVNKFLQSDQIQYLQRASETNPYTWTNKTIRDALQIKCAVGNKGYEFLRSISYPLPSSRTLNRRIESLKFSPGIQHDIIVWLGIKLQALHDENKLCVLSLDEMQLRPSVEYDKGLKRYVGVVSKEFSDSDDPVIASHALVFVLRGLTVHWKQVIAYVLTGNSTNPHKMWNFVCDVIKCLYSHGFLVKCATSDMGVNNTGMWGVIGVHSIRNQVNCKIAHPCKPEENIYFVADVPHILKNIRNCLLSQNITLPEGTVSVNRLRSNCVSLDHVEVLVNLQKDGGPVLVPNLIMKEIRPSAFEKMRVPVARSLFSFKVASALLHCVSTGDMSQEADATSWFTEQVTKWYDVMQSRHKSNSLNHSPIEKISFLKEILQWFPSLNFSGKHHWKAIQTGVQLSTTSALELFKDLSSRGFIYYLLTSRLSTDCVESFFSQVRAMGDSHPTPVKLRQVIRMISVAQYYHVPQSSSYGVDDDEYYLDYFSTHKPVKETSEYEPQFPNECEISTVQMSGLYYLAGWTIHKLVRMSRKVTCDSCIQSICSPEPSKTLPHEWTTLISKGNLLHPSESAFSIVRYCEQTFQQQSNALLQQENVKENLTKFIIQSSTERVKGPACLHNISEVLISAYLSVRLHIFANDLNNCYKTQKLYGSKTSFMQTAADLHK